MIILDFETNSTHVHDVIEVAAFRVEEDRDNNRLYKVVDTFHRYYYSKYEVNSYALAVHKLSPERIKKLRKDVSYVEYFEEDSDFIRFCESSSTLVAHNISFELRHITPLLSFKKHFCTMKENKKIVKVSNKNGNIKNPKLIETCHYYNIDFDEDQYHSALYDITKTLDIVNAMKIVL